MSKVRRSDQTQQGQAKQYQPQCKLCDESYPLERMKLGYAVCLSCGDEIAKERKFTIVPMHKSNYVAVTNVVDLKQLNPKRINE
jgi:ribosomal protein L37AE/L43A